MAIYKPPYTGNIWHRKFWQSIQVKTIGKEKFGKKAIVNAYANTFSVYL